MCRDVVLCVCRDLFPSGRFLLMYRDLVAVSKSMYRCSMTVPVLRLKFLSGGKTDSFVKTATDKLGVDLSSVCKPMCSGIMFGVLNAALRIALYLNLRRRGFDISALRYEDLVARPLDMCRVILEFCHQLKRSTSIHRLTLTWLNVPSDISRNHSWRRRWRRSWMSSWQS